MRRVRKSMLALLAVALAASLSCHGRSLGIRRVGDEVSGTGTVRHYSAEGGFYAIRGDDGQTYEPMVLEPRFEVDGLRVRFAGTVRDDVVSFHAVGSVIELAKINRY